MKRSYFVSRSESPAHRNAMQLQPSNPPTETVLSVIPGSSDEERLVLAMGSGCDGHSGIVLRQESWSRDVGWFEQSRIAIEPNQLASIKSVLGTSCGGRHVCPRSTDEELPPRDVIPFDAASRAG